MVRRIDLERPALKPATMNARTYARAENNGASAAYINRNERYNNQARIINRQRCRNLRGAEGNFVHPPCGVIKLVNPLSGKTCPDAPYRMQSLPGKTPDQWAAIGRYYGFEWNIDLSPAIVTLPPHTTMPDVYQDYRAFMGVP